MAEEDTPNPAQAPSDETPNESAHAADALAAAQAAVDAMQQQFEDPATPEPDDPPTDTTEGPADMADLVAEAMAEANAEAPSATTQEAAVPAPEIQAFAPPSFEQNGASEDESRINFLGDVNLQVKIELGRTRMYVEDVLRLNEGSVVELDKLAGDPVDIFVNDRHIARGEVLVVNDNFCVRVSEILQNEHADDAA